MVTRHKLQLATLSNRHAQSSPLARRTHTHTRFEIGRVVRSAVRQRQRRRHPLNGRFDDGNGPSIFTTEIQLFDDGRREVFHIFMRRLSCARVYSTVFGVASVNVYNLFLWIYLGLVFVDVLMRVYQFLLRRHIFFSLWINKCSLCVR